MLLTIELVPKTAWFANVRSAISQEAWDILRKRSYRKAAYRCEICGGIGKRHPVECHEIWRYDDVKHIQKLMGLISLCPSCHEVKHIGLAFARNRGDNAKVHLAKVNAWSERKTQDYIAEQFSMWRERSRHEWKIDLTWLDDKNIKYQKPRSEKDACD